MARNPYKVVVVGGGVAGLSAAHELAKRGFAVEVYERRGYFGGKAASVTIGVDNGYTTGPRGLPGEHGYRFFPGWYRHLPATMKEIPYKDRTVFANLVPADTNWLVSYDRDPVKALLRLPTSFQELKTLAAFPAELMRLGLTADDMQFFFGKLLEFATSSEERRVREYDTQTWAQFLDADKRSPAFRAYLVEAATRNTVAARPDEASAYTIGRIAIQTLLDTLNPETFSDQVLNGPTSEVWIDPWLDSLRGRGVRLISDAELDSVEFDGGQISGLRFQFGRQEGRLAAERVAHIQRLAAGPRVEPAPGQATLLTDADEVEFRSRLVAAIDESTMAKWEAGSGELRADVVKRLSLLTKIDQASLLDRARADAEKIVETANAQSSEPVTADYFVFALPIEQMAYYVNRSSTITSYDPALKNILTLSSYVGWMSGIQFYLTDAVTITRGHIDLLDSEWSLTGILQTQFWHDFDVRTRATDPLGQKVRAIFSVDISAWDRRGRVFRKEAYNCTREEIAIEVWEQIKRSLNRPGKADLVRDDMLLGFSKTTGTRALPGESYYLDDSVVDRLDRKKQALYEKFRSVQFSSDDLIRKQERPNGEAPQTSYQSGNRLLFNVEPLLVNRVGSLALRPAARTAIPNMFLAGDYVRTNTNLATMEGANEAARTAVNEILLASGSAEAPCEIWPLSEPLELFRRIDQSLFRRERRFQDSYADIPIRLAAGAATTAARMAAKVLGKVLDRE